MISALDSQIVKLLNPKRGGGLERDPLGLRELLDLCWPAFQYIEMPIANGTLAYYASPDDLPSDPWFLAKDGLLPLYLFFRNCPDPGGFQGRVLIPFKFANLIPDAWLERSAVYDALPAKTRPLSTGFKSLVLCGLNYDLVCGIQSLRLQLREIKDHLQNSGSYTDDLHIKALLIRKGGGYGLDYFSSHNTQFVLEILRTFPDAKFQWLNSQEFASLKPADGDRFFEINPMGLYSFSSFKAQLLSVGFQSLTDCKIPEHSRLLRIPISENYSLAISKPELIEAPNLNQLSADLNKLVADIPNANTLIRNATWKA